MGWVKDDVIHMVVSSNNSSADADSSYSALEICSYVCDNAHEAFVFHCCDAINELKFHSRRHFSWAPPAAA